LVIWICGFRNGTQVGKRDIVKP